MEGVEGGGVVSKAATETKSGEYWDQDNIETKEYGDLDMTFCVKDNSNKIERYDQYLFQTQVCF